MGRISCFAGFRGSAQGRTGKGRAEPLRQVPSERENFVSDAPFQFLTFIVFPENNGCITHFAGFTGSGEGRSGKDRAEPLHQAYHERRYFFLETALHRLTSHVFPENNLFHLKPQSLLHKVPCQTYSVKRTPGW